MVLCRHHEIARPGRLGDRCNSVEVTVSRSCIECRDEVVILKINTVCIAVMLPSRAPFNLHRVAVPLCIRVMTKHAFGALSNQHLLDIGYLLCPTGHRVEPPVNEDSELRVVVPTRKLVTRY